MRLWHFTAEEHLEAILTAGYLKLSDSNLSAPWERHRSVPYVVWFVDTPELNGFQHGLAPEGVRMSVDKTRVRISVEVPDHWTRHWVDWADAQGMNPLWKAAMIEAAGGPEAAERWWVTYRRVQFDRWSEVRIDGRVFWSRRVGTPIVGGAGA